MLFRNQTICLLDSLRACRVRNYRTRQVTSGCGRVLPMMYVERLMKNREDLDKRFDAILADKTTGSNVTDFELRRAVAALGKSVLGLDDSVVKLDRSSSRLACTNIVLGGAILIVGIVQIVLMARGR
jgi:hypothetical protein